MNNAGRTFVAPPESLAEADWRRTLDLSLTAYFVLSQEVGRGMLAWGRGRIINVSSVASARWPSRSAWRTVSPRRASTC